MSERKQHGVVVFCWQDVRTKKQGVVVFYNKLDLNHDQRTTISVAWWVARRESYDFNTPAVLVFDEVKYNVTEEFSDAKFVPEDLKVLQQHNW